MALEPSDPRYERYARAFDLEIAPIWSARFAEPMLRGLSLRPKVQVLDVGCLTGDVIVELLARMEGAGRIIAIDPRAPMVDVARRKVAALGPLGERAVFFRTEPIAKLAFADDVYDLVVSNLALHEHADPKHLLVELARVCRPGGEVRCALPLAGTFGQLHDLYREVLMRRGDDEAIARLEAYIATYPTYEQIQGWCAAAGLAARIELSTFTILFRSGREFFYSPFIESGPLSAWRDIVGDVARVPEVFNALKQTIDTYFDKRPFEISVHAAAVVARKVEAPRDGDV